MKQQIDKDALYEDLLKTFIYYQYRLDHPLPCKEESEAYIFLKYHTDRVLHNKVQSLV